MLTLLVELLTFETFAVSEISVSFDINTSSEEEPEDEEESSSSEELVSSDATRLNGLEDSLTSKVVSEFPLNPMTIDSFTVEENLFTVSVNAVGSFSGSLTSQRLFVAFVDVTGLVFGAILDTMLPCNKTPFEGGNCETTLVCTILSNL